MTLNRKNPVSEGPRRFCFSGPGRGVWGIALAVFGGVAFADASAPVACAAPSVSPLRITFSADRVLERNFLGFGVEWEYEGDHPENNVENPVWTNRWSEMTRRVDFMRPAILRVMHDARMYTRLEQGRFVPDYESPRMRTMYQVLDYAKTRNIPLVFGEWWLHKTYREQLSGVDDPRWSKELIVPFLAYLREHRGYVNITYFNLMNEPAGLPVEYDVWRRSILSLHAELDERGLAEDVRIVGSDGPGDWCQWIGKIARDAELRPCIGAYEYHLYAHLKTDKWSVSLLEGLLGPGELASRRREVNLYDPDGKRKPFFMGEAGIEDGAFRDQQTNRYQFAYGVWMTDYAVQSMNAGQAGLIAWDMDDAMHTWGSYGSCGLKGWGFWNSLAGSDGYPPNDFDLRPWFYTWSLLCRCFPAGAQIMAVEPTGDSSVRAAAALLPGKKGISFVVVNEAQTARRVLLKMSGMEMNGIRLNEYRYFSDNRPADDEGFPVAANEYDGKTVITGLGVELPARGCVIVSTL